MIYMLYSLKSLIRRVFYRSSLFRGLVGTMSVMTGRTPTMGISHLLSYREDDAVGPLQRDEALALFGIVKTIRPKVLVEFGFFHGHSAFNFLQAMPKDGRLYSYDISPDSCTRARDEFGFDPRFTFIGKSQTHFDPKDIDHHMIDFVFFDAAHELELNTETFSRVVCQLALDGMIAVHDTGLWHRSHFSDVHHTFANEMAGEWKSEDLYAHQPGERAFIDWIVDHHPEFSVTHFHSTDTLRHGFSLLQRKRSLSL